MAYRSSNVQEAYGNSGATKGGKHTEETSSPLSTAGSHDEYRTTSRVATQSGRSGEATTGFHAEDSGSTYGSSNQSTPQRTYKGADSGSSGSSTMVRHRVSTEGYSSGPTGTMQSSSSSSSGNVGTRHTDRFGGNSTGHTSVSTTGQSGSYGSSSSGQASGSTGGYRTSSGASASGSSGSYGASSSGQGSGSSGPRVGFSGSTSSGSRSGSGGFSSRSTGGYSSRSSGFSTVSGGIGGSSGGQRGGFSTHSVSGYSSGGGEGLLQAGEKETMQNLNSRLSAYMDKVRALEDSNSVLEDQIRSWYETHKPKQIDNSKYYKTIEEIKDKINGATMDTNELSIEGDNARLAADDFRVKFENELRMRQSVESDIEGLRKLLDDLTLEKASLESQVENLREEIASNKKIHDEDMKGLQGQTSDVNVQVDAAPGINILTVLNDIRSQYEQMAEENRRKAEDDYNQKITELSNEISYSSAEIETGKSEAMELRRNMQTMEIELHSQLAMKNSLEHALAETQARYASQLNQIQGMVVNMEEQLAQVRNDMENQSCEYKVLLDIKNRLENEIEMYRRLLDGEGGSSSGSRGGSNSGSRNSSNSGSGSGSASGSSSGSGFGSSSGSGTVSNSNESFSRRSDSMSTADPKKNRLVTTITEERLDGRLVSTKVDKIPQKM